MHTDMYVYLRLAGIFLLFELLTCFQNHLSMKDYLKCTDEKIIHNNRRHELIGANAVYKYNLLPGSNILVS